MWRPITLTISLGLLAGCSADKTELPRASRRALTNLSATAADRPLVYVGGKPFLPKWKTADELRLEQLSREAHRLNLPGADIYDTYRTTHIDKFFITLPPVSTNFRVVAEFEPSQVYLMAWENYNDPEMNALFREIVKAVWGKVPVLMTYTDAGHKQWLEGQLTTAGLSGFSDATKIIWYQHETDGTWARDYGPVSLVTTDAAAKLSFVDFKYYHPRIHGDETPADLAAQWGINDFRPDLEFEGGNFMNTSDGLCITSKVTLQVNTQYDQAAIEDLFKKYLNCKKMLFLTQVVGDGTGHVDMFSKLGSDTKILLGEFTATQDAQNKTVLDQNATLLASTTNPTGQTLQVTRIPMPDWGKDYYGKFLRTYTNSQALASATTKTILIPVYAKETSKQAAALAAYSTVFSGWTQVPIAADAIIPMGGAIHCVLYQIAAGAKSKMEADPVAQCGQKYTCTTTVGCGDVSDVGCCDGTVVKWCENNKVETYDCAQDLKTPQCGWYSSYGVYDCASTTSTDPSGQNPRSCGAVAGDLGPRLDKTSRDLGSAGDTALSDLGLPPEAGEDQTGITDQSGPGLDRSLADGATPPDPGGCSCQVASKGEAGSTSLLLLGLGLAASLRRRRRR